MPVLSLSHTYTSKWYIYKGSYHPVTKHGKFHLKEYCAGIHTISVTCQWYFSLICKLSGLRNVCKVAAKFSYTVTTKFSFLCIATISAKEAAQFIAKIPKGLLLASFHLLFLQPLFKGGSVILQFIPPPGCKYSVCCTHNFEGWKEEITTQAMYV